MARSLVWFSTFMCEALVQQDLGFLMKAAVVERLGQARGRAPGFEEFEGLQGGLNGFGLEGSTILRKAVGFQWI